MTTYAAFLRAVNLGPHNKVGMAELRGLLTDLGMQGVQTLLQSGNAVFRSGAPAAAQLERVLEEGAAMRLGLATDFFVRSAKDWDAVVAGNPFPEEAERDPGHLLLYVLKDAPGREAEKALQTAIVGREVVRVRGRHAYVVYPDGVGRSRLTIALLERKLGTRGTGRNWNTVLKLGELLEAPR